MPAKDVKQFLLSLTMTQQGEIKGSSTKGRRGSPAGIECLGFKYDIQAPRDAASGLPTGKREHKPIVITREVDSASPKLLQACCTNEVIESAVLSFSTPGAGGDPMPVRKIELTNGAIVAIRAAGTRGGRKCQEFILIYEKLKVDNMPGGHIPYAMLG